MNSVRHFKIILYTLILLPLSCSSGEMYNFATQSPDAADNESIYGKTSITATELGGGTATIKWKQNDAQQEMDSLDYTLVTLELNGAEIEQIQTIDATYTFTSATTIGFYTFTVSHIDSAGDVLTEKSETFYIPTNKRDVTYLNSDTFSGIYSSDLDGYYILSEDIDLSLASSISQIGSLTNGFTGIFDGRGYSIENYSSTGADNYYGIFASVNSEMITNVCIKNATADNTSDATAIFIGTASDSTIQNISIIDSTLTTSGDSCGLLIGEATGKITIKNCSAQGTVAGEENIGGLVGSINGTDCETLLSSFTGTVYGGGSSIGGLIGTNSGSVDQCYASADVTAQGSKVGGLVGLQENENITNCYTTGEVSGSIIAGGIVGENSAGSITKCYSIAVISASYSPISGIVATIVDSGSSDDCYTTATINSSEGEVKALSDMQKESTYIGWDFNSIWTLDSSLNGGLPYLKNTPLQ